MKYDTAERKVNETIEVEKEMRAKYFSIIIIIFVRTSSPIPTYRQSSAVAR